ncbi:MAG: hypothetical protein L3K05_01195 [Thermoplasmata archaeon]|nr:hypothetical protein [Thermoplasmata archaeon]
MGRRTALFVASLVVLVVISTLVPSAGAAVRTSSGTPPGSGSGNGSLVLSVTPASAAVKVNGTNVELGSGGSATISLAPGSYDVVATAHGDSAFDGNVTILAGQTNYLSIQLTASPSTSGPSSITKVVPLSVLATIAGAAVIVVLAFVILRPDRRGADEKETPADPVKAQAPEPDEGPA